MLSSDAGEGGREEATAPAPPVPGWLTERFGACLVVRSPSGLAVRPSRPLITDPNVATIVVVTPGRGSQSLWRHLGRLLGMLRDEGFLEVRLAVSGAGRRGAESAVAQQVADAYGFDVIAPDGHVIVIPDGSLFSLAAASADGTQAERQTGTQAECLATWWRFRPQAEPEAIGPRQPEPRWQASMDDALEPAIAGCRYASAPDASLVGYPVPAGLLLLPADASPPSPGELAYSVPPGSAHLGLLLGRPGAPAVRGEDVADWISSLLPERLWRGVQLVPYGPEPPDEAPRGQIVADRLGVEVRALAGVPISTDAVRREIVVFGADLRPVWKPFVRIMVYAPGGRCAAPVVADWIVPAQGLREVDDGTYELGGGWVVEIIPAGLWVRTSRTEPPAAPFDSAGATLVLGAAETPLDGPAAWYVAGLLARLPEDARKIMRIWGHVVSPEVGDEIQHAATVYGIGRGARVETVWPEADEAAEEVPEQPGEAKKAAAPDAAEPEVAVSDAAVPEVKLSGHLPRAEASPEAPGKTVQAGGAALDATPQSPSGGLAPLRHRPVRRSGPFGPAITTSSGERIRVRVVALPAADDADRLGGLPSLRELGVMTNFVVLPGRPLPADGPGAGKTVTPAKPVPRGHTSTPEERRQFRELLGDRYASVVSQPIGEFRLRPGRDVEGREADLVAVRLYMSARDSLFDQITLDSALRRNAAGALRPYVACLVSGLGRLVSLRGTVFRGGRMPAAGPRAYHPGQVIVERSCTSAITDDRADFGTPLEYVVWSEQGSLVPAGTGEQDEVVFPPMSRFVVLAVWPAPASGGAARVLLRELPYDGDGERRQGSDDIQDVRDASDVRDERARMDRTVLAWLTVAANRRDEALAGEPRPVEWPDRFTVPLGTDMTSAHEPPPAFPDQTPYQDERRVAPGGQLAEGAARR